MAMNSSDSSQNRTDIHLQKCLYHDTENQTFYCVNHDVTICGRCLHSNHKTCIDDCVDLFTVTVDDTRLSEAVATLSEFEKEIEVYEKALNEDIRLNDECKSNTMEVVGSFCSKLMKRLTDLKDNAERDCTQKHKQISESLSQVVKKCEEQKLIVNQRKQLVEELVQKRHNRHLYIELVRLDRKKKEISVRIKRLNQGKQIEQFSFRPNDKLEKLLCCEINDIGRIQDTADGSDDITTDIVQDYTCKEEQPRVRVMANMEMLVDKNTNPPKTDTGQRNYFTRKQSQSTTKNLSQRRPTKTPATPNTGVVSGQRRDVFGDDDQCHVDYRQLQNTLQRQAEASKQMLYSMYGNVIVMLEEYEGRTERIQLSRSDIDIPDQSWKTDENLKTNVESQLVLFKAHRAECPSEVASSVNRELRLKVIFWAAVREVERMPHTATDTYIARLYEILVKGETLSLTLDQPGQMMTQAQKLWWRTNEAMDIDGSYEQNPQKAASPKTRTPTNTSDIHMGAKRIQDVIPSLGPYLQEDVRAAQFEIEDTK